MDILGNEQDARLIRDFVLTDQQRAHGRMGCPDGWQFLGHGSYRSVWLSPEGVCYKVEHEYHPYSSDNAKEYRNWRDWTRNCILPEGTRIPNLTYYELSGRPVIAMERVNGETLFDAKYFIPEEEIARFRDLMYELEEELGSLDIHDENVMVDYGTMELVIVDLQM